VRDTFSNHVVEIEKHLRMIASTVRRRGRMLLEQYNITPPQFDALVILDRDGVLTIGDLSNRLYLAYSTTTDLVDRLERASFVVRERDSEDRRVVRVRLLEQGRQMIENVLDARRAYLAGVLESVSSKDQEEILRILQLLNDKMDKD
jgi:MarR family transcriptional regulator, organic hydroperoxide resistance regulator